MDSKIRVISCEDSKSSAITCKDSEISNSIQKLAGYFAIKSANNVKEFDCWTYNELIHFEFKIWCWHFIFIFDLNLNTSYFSLKFCLLLEDHCRCQNS